jgi:hypothetical protein
MDTMQQHERMTTKEWLRLRNELGRAKWLLSELPADHPKRSQLSLLILVLEVRTSLSNGGAS